ncbi:MAG: hypothetical protein GXY67_00305 [Clostridiales bacterium]|mgnify:FL=1|nr:hypothetical protein [Clostridiales bacterium]
MLKWEEKLVNSIQKNILLWAAAIAAVLGVFIRYSFMPLIVADMKFLLIPWYEAAGQGGIQVLAVQGGVPEVASQSNYLPLYLYIFTAVAKLGVPSVVGIKLISVAFEVPLIAAICLLVYATSPVPRKKLNTTIAFIILCLHPLLILNASGWGQADVIYGSFSLLSVLLLTKGKNTWAMVCFAISFAFKLQALFLMPLFVMVYFCEKKLSLWQFLLVPVVVLLTSLPMGLFGHSPFYAVTCYLGQMDMYQKPTFNYPNFYAMLGEALSGKQPIQGMISRYGMALALASLGGMLVWLIVKRARLSRELLPLLGCWCILCTTFFMPRMHERYGFVGEMLLLCWAVSLGKPRGYAYLLLGVIPIASAYGEYMFRKPIFSLQLGGFLNLALLGLLTWELVKAVNAAGWDAVRVEARSGIPVPLTEEAL